MTTVETKVGETVDTVKKPLKKIAPKIEGEVEKKVSVKKTETKSKPKVTTEIKAEKPAIKKIATPKVAIDAIKPEDEVKKVAEVKVSKSVKPEVKPEVEVKKVAEVKEEKPVTKKVKTSKSVKIEKFEATGKRKKSVARVKLVSGSGVITINNRNIEEYFPIGTLPIVAKQPLELTQTLNKLDVFAVVFGGGFSGQAGAIRNAISKALLLVSDTYRAELKKAGYLTRDSRIKERKKYGLKKARKAPQYSKR